MSKSRLQQVRDAIYDVFGDVIAINAIRDWREDWRDRPADVAMVKRSIERDTFTGEDDPGGWARNASVVIHCEQDIPNGTYESVIFEQWWKVQEKLGKDLLVEHINAAVIGVYRK